MPSNDNPSRLALFAPVVDATGRPTTEFTQYMLRLQMIADRLSNPGRLPPGDTTDADYWRRLRAGLYWLGAGATNAPAVGFVTLKRLDGSFSATLEEQPAGDVYRVSGDENSASVSWVQVSQ